MSGLERVVLDASVVIGYLTRGDVHQSAAIDILDADEWIEFAIHPFTLAESLVGPASRGEAELAISALESIGVESWSPDAGWPRRLAALRSSTELRLPDCCPLDAAEQLGAALATFDDRLARTARERGVEVLGAD